MKIVPRVLIINQVLDNSTGGGVTATNLFKNWGKDNLAIACMPSCLQKNGVDITLCDNYYQLGYEEFYFVFPFNMLQKKYPSGKVVFEGKGIQNLRREKSKLRVRFIIDFIFPVLRALGLYNFIGKYKLSEKFKNWVEEFRPDVIYTLTDNYRILCFNNELQRTLNSPMVYHQMDDWHPSLKNNGILSFYWKPIIKKHIAEMFSRTSLFLSICDFMSLEYKRRYGLDFESFHNPVELQFWKPFQKEHYELGGQPTIRYSGRIGLGINESLRVVSKAVELINMELNLGLKFVISGPEKPTWSDEFESTQFREFVPYKDVPLFYSGADLLILPYDFTKKSIEFIRYSMPTKATEYMASGAPIMVFAPEETAIVDYFNKNKCAKVVIENSAVILAEAIKELILSRSKREELGKKAKEIVEKNHSAEVVRARFKEKICSIVREKPHKR